MQRRVDEVDVNMGEMEFKRRVSMDFRQRVGG